ncbi:unnamed protein product [Effrenium voratum]|uniref:Multifunctional methyltransferase subunit TRM112-like protein n=1 Tax=Effrenium voratum TaxID=2562239 RepID=A0AA36JIT6_9DINO|nr:unnamed protein product [Effrenium voratum]CAJ1407028.1 unnamed protein product [Effrenium voratum]CAJ1455436.1 unnamed protein product [Effrenium voratum]
MRLMTHNVLQCNKKGVQNGFPLIIKATSMKYEETPFDKSFVSAMIPKIEYHALLKAVSEVQQCPNIAGMDKLGSLPVLPLAMPANPDEDEDFLRRLHTVLFDLSMLEGELVCPESGRVFPVNDGIPNMLLNDDEV